MDDNFASNHLPVHVSRYSSFNLKSDIHITFMIKFSESDYKCVELSYLYHLR